MTKLLTKQHHKLIQQFIDFKNRSEAKLKKADKLISHLGYLEQCFALKTPVMEAEYALDERTSLGLYDCLVPMLKEHRRFKINFEEKFSVNDFKTQQRVKELEYEL